MAQTWHDLLFAHWPIDPLILRPLVPPQLRLDLYQGRCWIGIVPFWMSHVRARFLPPIPGLSRFPELNVRTYVTHGEKPGVYFFSLDAANLPAVWAARTFFHLPYFYAKMSVKFQKDWIVYNSERHRDPAELRGRYRPIKPVELSTPGSLEHWLTERYCLYTVHEDQLFRVEIHHKPWPLQAAEASLETSTMAEAADISPLEGAPLLHFSRRQEVIVWPLERVAEAIPLATKTQELISEAAWNLENGTAASV
jgi:uncharacterized protein YqjF (DUF2071 family)